jgi:hypothetical protein
LYGLRWVELARSKFVLSIDANGLAALPGRDRESDPGFC